MTVSEEAGVRRRPEPASHGGTGRVETGGVWRLLVDSE